MLGEPLCTGVAVGNGAARRQIGRFIFGVGVGEGPIVGGRGLNFGVGVGVGTTAGGTRGSGKPGSSAAAITSVRFQSGPYGSAFFFSGAGVTVTGAILSTRFSVTWPMTRSPERSPTAMPATSAMMPRAKMTVMKRLDGSSTDRYV